MIQPIIADTSVHTIEAVVDMPEQVGVIELDGLSIPILEMKWADERQWCTRVHDYLAGDGSGHPAGCPMLDEHPRGGLYCRGNGKAARSACLFHEAPDSEGWQKAQRWTRVEIDQGNGTEKTGLARVEDTVIGPDGIRRFR